MDWIISLQKVTKLRFVDIELSEYQSDTSTESLVLFESYVFQDYVLFYPYQWARFAIHSCNWG